MHKNIRSIAKNFDEFTLMLTGCNVNFDCIVLSETFQIHDQSFFSLDGYDLIYNRGTNNKNDGILMFISRHVNYSYQIVSIANSKCIELAVITHDKEKL